MKKRLWQVFRVEIQIEKEAGIAATIPVNSSTTGRQTGDN